MKLKSFEDLKKAMEAQSAEPAAGHVFYAPDPWGEPVETYPKGWFFYDEAYDVHGPYATEEKAREGLKAYCVNVLEEKP